MRLMAMAMAGSISAAVVAIRHPDVGGLGELFRHPEVANKLSLLPDFSDPAALVPMFLIPVAVQWWAAWYPGAEPGGGGYPYETPWAIELQITEASRTWMRSATSFLPMAS